MTSTVLLPLLTLACMCSSQDLSQTFLTTSQWSVRTTVNSSNHCLLASGNFTLVLPQINKDNTSMAQVNRTWVVPENATAKGACGELSSELNLHWLDEATGKENVMNLVISKVGRLAALTGIFTRLHTGANKAEIEMSGQIDLKDFNTLVWPIRYGLSCPASLQYPLYHAPNPISETLTASSSSSVVTQETNHHQTPMAYLVVENIKLEAFREVTLVDQYPESMSQEFYRRKWECEFHMTFDWAPIAVGGGLACLVSFMLGAFLCKSSIGCGDGARREKYEKF